MKTKFLFVTAFLAISTAAPAAKYAAEQSDLTEIVYNLQAKVEQLETKSTVQEKEIEILKSQEQTHMTAKANVESLFLATIGDESISISDEEPIIWDSAPINPGGHFNTILGAYTAPSDGYYQFSVTKRSNSNRSYFWILVDEERYAYSTLYTENASSPTGSMTINIQLTAGQIIRIENQSSTSILGTNSNGIIQSWFTGFLLFAL